MWGAAAGREDGLTNRGQMVDNGQEVGDKAWTKGWAEKPGASGGLRPEGGGRRADGAAAGKEGGLTDQRQTVDGRREVGTNLGREDGLVDRGGSVGLRPGDGGRRANGADQDASAGGEGEANQLRADGGRRQQGDGR